MTPNQLKQVTDNVKQALDELENLKVTDKKFILQDLFKGYVWKRIDVQVRKKMGGRFLEEVNKRKDIKVLGKTSSNQQMYEKI